MLATCREWEFDKPRKPESRRKPKGHKHDRLKPQRCGAAAAVRTPRVLPPQLNVATTLAALPLLAESKPSKPSWRQCQRPSRPAAWRAAP